VENVTPIDVSYQPIELCKLLKIANMVGGGGEAKIVISEGYVFVNGEVEYQKRKKVYHQDIIEFNGELIEVSCSEPVSNVKQTPTIKSDIQAKVTTSKTKQNKNTTKRKQQTAIQKTEIQKTPGHRKRISF